MPAKAGIQETKSERTPTHPPFPDRPSARSWKDLSPSQIFQIFSVQGSVEERKSVTTSSRANT